MKAIRILLILLALYFGTALGAQSIITGQVRTIKGTSVEYARVLALSPKDSTILSYAFTDARGAYQLKVNSSLSELILSVSSMEIERTDKRVRNTTQTCHFSVREFTTVL